MTGVGHEQVPRRVEGEAAGGVELRWTQERVHGRRGGIPTARREAGGEPQPEDHREGHPSHGAHHDCPGEAGTGTARHSGKPRGADAEPGRIERNPM